MATHIVFDTARDEMHQVHAWLETRDKLTQVTVRFQWLESSQSPWLTRKQLGAYIQFLSALAENCDRVNFREAELQFKGFVQDYVSQPD